MGKPIQCVQVAFTSTSGATPVQFDGQEPVTGFILHTSADCYVDFDQPVSTSQSFKLLSANTADTTIDGFGGTVRRFYVQGVTGSGTLFIIATIK